MLDRLRRFLGHVIRGGSVDDARVRITADGFEVVRATKLVHRVNWSRVEEVYAYKQDHWTVDCIYLGFLLTDSGDRVELSEETPGYLDLMKAMQFAFPDHNEKWVSAVAFPSFATNLTTVWRRAGSTTI